MSNVPLKRCKGPCGQEYPATTEYWRRKSDGVYGLNPRCKECLKGRPEVLRYQRAYMKEYNRRPEVQIKKKEYLSRPEVKEYRNRYEVKERYKEQNREYLSRPEVQRKKKKNT